jgi:MFS family permease
VSDSEASIHPRKVLFPLGLGTALSLMGDGTLYTVLPTHTVEAGIALSSVGIILGVNRAVRLFLNGPAGLAYDRWPRRRLFVPALFIGALSTAVYAATRGFWPMLVGRLLWGLAWSGIWVGGATVILDVTTDQDRGRWTGLYQTWFFLGAALSTLAGGLLTDQLGYGATMWVGVAVTAVGGVAALILLPETRAARSGLDDPLAEENSLRLRANRDLWVVASLHGLNRFVTAGVLTATLALLVQDRLSSVGPTLGVATLTGVLMAGRTLLSMVAAPLAGTASDRLGSRWGVAAWGLAVGVVSMALVAWGEPLAILAGVSLGAVAGGSIQALAMALTGDLVSQAQRGRAIGLLHTAGDLGSAVGPPAAYVLMSWLELKGVYLLCAGLFAAGLALAMLFRPRTTAPP